MDWEQIDKHTLKSRNPSGYTVAKNVSEGATIYEAYGPRLKDGMLNLLNIHSSAAAAKRECQQLAEQNHAAL